eukprot:2629516-Alexandrium_andersonii.AAC.1
MAQRRMVLRTADFRPCRDAVRVRGRLLAVFSGLGLVRVRICERCTGPELGREPLERGRSAAARGPHGWLVG